jgi:hypothetical protein
MKNQLCVVCCKKLLFTNKDFPNGEFEMYI